MVGGGAPRRHPAVATEAVDKFHRLGLATRRIRRTIMKEVLR